MPQGPIPGEYKRCGPTMALRTGGTPQCSAALRERSEVRTTTAAPARVPPPPAAPHRPAPRDASRACVLRRQRPLFAPPQPPPNGHPRHTLLTCRGAASPRGRWAAPPASHGRLLLPLPCPDSRHCERDARSPRREKPRGATRACAEWERPRLAGRT